MNDMLQNNIYIVPLKCQVKSIAIYCALNFPMDKQDGMAIPKILGKHGKTRGVLIDLETTKYCKFKYINDNLRV